MPYCRICGEHVEPKNKRAHLAEHNEHAWSLEYVDIEDQYQTAKPELVIAE